MDAGRDSRLDDARADAEDAAHELENARAELAEAEKAGIGTRRHLSALDRAEHARRRETGARVWLGQVEDARVRAEAAAVPSPSRNEIVGFEEFQARFKHNTDALAEARMQLKDADQRLRAARVEAENAANMHPPETADSARAQRKRLRGADDEVRAMEALRRGASRKVEDLAAQQQQLENEKFKRAQQVARLRGDLSRAPLALANREKQTARKIEELERLAQIEKREVEKLREHFRQAATMLEKLSGEPIDNELKAELWPQAFDDRQDAA